MGIDPLADIKYVREQIVKRVLEEVQNRPLTIGQVRQLTEVSVRPVPQSDDWVVLLALFQSTCSTLESRMAQSFAPMIPWNMIAKDVLNELEKSNA